MKNSYSFVRAAVLTAAVLLCSSLPSLAANCGGATACSCGDTVTSSYTMTSNLDCSATGADALNFGSNVTLDCAGFSVIGGNVVGVRGLYVNNDQNVVISQCTVKNFDLGIRIRDSSAVTVSDSVILDNLKYGIEVSDQAGVGFNSSSVSIVLNDIRNNGDEGIHMSGDTGASHIPQHEIIGNVLSDNFCEAIYILNINGTQSGGTTYGVRVLQNNLFGNGNGSGCASIFVDESSVNRFRYNSLTHDNMGFRLSSNNWLGNQVINFGRIKFEQDSDNNEMTRVCVQGNGTMPDTSFVFDDSKGNTCAACVALGAQTYDISATNVVGGTNSFTTLRYSSPLRENDPGNVVSVTQGTSPLPCMQ